MKLAFKDKIRSLDFDTDRTTVTFSTKPAFFWLCNEDSSLLERLRAAYDENLEVDIQWDPTTKQIVNVSLS